MHEIKLSKHGLIDNYAKYYHNNLDINDWKRNKKVDTINKILIRLVELYLLPGNEKKPINKRVIIQNTALSYETHVVTDDLMYSITTRQVQKILVKLQELKIIDELNYFDAENNVYKYNATTDDWNGEQGLTKRAIVLNIKRAKEFLSLTNTSSEYVNAEARSTIRRSIMRRPFTLVDLIRDINNQIVADIREATKILNPYLEAQARKYQAFEDNSSALDEVIKEAKTNLYNVLYEVPDNDIQ